MKTLRVLLAMWRASLESELEYRLNFVVTLTTSMLGLGFGVLGVGLFYDDGRSFPGWTYEESLVVLGFFTLLTGYVGCLLSPNLSNLVGHVESGSLDFVLLKPFDSQVHVSARELSPWGLPDLALGLGLIVYGARAASPSFVDVALAFLALASSLALVSALWFLVASTSIWFVRIYNATEVLRGLLDVGRFPITAYPPLARALFTFGVPIAFLTTVPAEVLLGRSAPRAIGVALVVSLVAIGLSRVVWRRALRSYTSASS